MFQLVSENLLPGNELGSCRLNNLFCSLNMVTGSLLVMIKSFLASDKSSEASHSGDEGEIAESFSVFCMSFR